MHFLIYIDQAPVYFCLPGWPARLQGLFAILAIPSASFPNVIYCIRS